MYMWKMTITEIQEGKKENRKFWMTSWVRPSKNKGEQLFTVDLLSQYKMIHKYLICYYINLFHQHESCPAWYLISWYKIYNKLYDILVFRLLLKKISSKFWLPYIWKLIQDCQWLAKHIFKQKIFKFLVACNLTIWKAKVTFRNSDHFFLVSKKLILWKR